MSLEKNRMLSEKFKMNRQTSIGILMTIILSIDILAISNLI